MGITIIAAVATAVLAAGYFMLVRPPFDVLYSDLRPAEASAIVAQLEQDGVPYKIGESGRSLLVPADKVDFIRLSLTNTDLPGLAGEGFELFDSSDLGLTEFAQKVKFQRALQGELARTILLMTDVADTRVHLTIPEKSFYRGEQKQAKAAVTLVMRSSVAPTQDRIRGVQELVAASIPDLAPGDVVVLDGTGAIISVRDTAVQELSTVAALPQNEDSLSPETRNVLNILRQTMPQGNFEVMWSEFENGTAPSAVAEGSVGAAPAVVASARRLTITSSDDLTPPQQEMLKEELVEAGVLDPEVSDVAFEKAELPQVHPEPVEAPKGLDATAAATLPSLEPPTTDARSLVLEPAALIALSFCGIASVGLLGFAAMRQRPQARALGGETHQQFAERLKLGLQSAENV